MSILEEYLRELRDIRSSGAGVPETSYYTPLANLLNEVGKALKPRVRTILQLANRGAGQPDGGLFTNEQLRGGDNSKPLMGQSPNRGVIEVKPASDNAWLTADGSQVSQYWAKYRQVLVTNYRDFVLVGQDADGKPVKLESYRLASNEAEFWSKANHPSAFANEQEVPFIEYLNRVMLHGAPIASPQEVAWFLASYARTAMARVEAQDTPALATLRSALEGALGLKFEGTKGDHFFRSTLVQTLFYGVFSSWVLWSKDHLPTAKDRFDWHAAAWTLRVPMIRALFEQIATPLRLGPLGLEEVLDWTSAVLNRVDRASFFTQFDQGQAVQYFYEPFLAAFDPQLRKDLGVWFTPPEIVRYMVERVDTVLREELNLPDGLADPNVYVLDPGNGTGSYLVEVLKRIAATLQGNGGGALAASDLKEAAMTRIFGFEILPASFVVAHLQLGLLLQSFGAPLDDKGQERVGVYLTNALTGWEPMDAEKEKAFQALLTGFPELGGERVYADGVKQDKPILVILGNPPYNAFAGTSPAEEAGLVNVYKEKLNTSEEMGGWGIKKFNLDDLYVRFFRLAERRIAEHTGKGVVCYISNFSYLSDPSFVVMRQRFLAAFDKLWFDCMNGDRRETGKRTPEGKLDPSVFSTEFNKAGIQVGTTVGLMVRKADREIQPTVRFRQFWGVTKRVDLLQSLQVQDLDSQYQVVSPDKSDRFSFRPSNELAEYQNWPSVADLCAVPPYNGPIERRGNSLILFPSQINEFKNLRAYLDGSVSDAEIGSIEPRFMKSSGEFKAEKARALLKTKATFNNTNIVRYPFKPLDVRVAYLHPGIQPLFSRPSPELLAQRSVPGNSFMVVRETGDKDSNTAPFYFSNMVCDYHCLVVEAKHIPIRLNPTLLTGGNISANLSLTARRYLTRLGITNPDADAESAGLTWMHVLAIGYSPNYLRESSDGLRMGWPRILLPGTKTALDASASLGTQVAALLDTENQVPGVTAGHIRPDLRSIGTVNRESDGSLQSVELAVTAGWGHSGQDGAVMPGKGQQ